MKKLTRRIQPRSLITCLLLDPALVDSTRIAEQMFGKHGLQYLALLRGLFEGGWIGMVGHYQREPARVCACRPDAVRTTVDQVLAMARTLADSSTWIINLPPDQTQAVVALLAEREECVGGLQ